MEHNLILGADVRNRKLQHIFCATVLILSANACTDERAGKIHIRFSADALLDGALGIVQLKDDCTPENTSSYALIRCLPGRPVEMHEISIADETILREAQVPTEWQADNDWIAAVPVRALTPGSTEVSMTATFDDGTTRSASLVVHVVVPDLITFPLAESGPPDCPPGRPTLRDQELEKIRVLVGEEQPLPPVVWGRPNRSSIGPTPDRLTVGGLINAGPLVSGIGASHEILHTVTWSEIEYFYKPRTSIIIHEAGEVEMIPALRGVNAKPLKAIAVREADLTAIDSLPLNPLRQTPGSTGDFRAIPRDQEGVRFCGGELFQRRLTVRSRTPEICLVRVGNSEGLIESTNPGSAEFTIQYINPGRCSYELWLPDMASPSAHESIVEGPTG